MPYVDDVHRRSKPLPELPPSENDRSSPERVGIPKNVTQRSADRARNVHTYIQNTRTPTPIINSVENTTRLSHNEVLKEESSTHHTEQPAEITDKVGLLRSSTNTYDSSPPAMGDIKPSLIHRLTSKLHIATPTTTSSSQPTASAAEVKQSSRPPRSPRATSTLPNSFVSRENREAALRERGLRPPCKDLSEQEREADEAIPATTSAARLSHPLAEAKHSSRPPRSSRATPTLPNSFVSREKREAALRERGLRPPRKDLSEQEREADERLVPVPLPDLEKSENGPSAASKIKEEWLIMNRSSFPSTSMTTSFLSSS